MAMVETETKPSRPMPLTAATYAEYAEALNRYFVRRVRRPEDASDLCQEVFELFIRRYRHPEVIRNPLAYLFRLAFHAVGDALSKQNRERVTFNSDMAER